MKITPIAILLFVIFISQALAQECDYGVELTTNNSADFLWSMKAENLEGPVTLITGTAIIQGTGETKSYTPWNNLSISRQKTSPKYSPNLKPGKYAIEAQIQVQCHDINTENNKDVKEFTITAGSDSQEANKSPSTPQTKPKENPDAKTQNEEYNNIIYLKTKEIQTMATNEYISSARKSAKFALPLLLAASIIVNIILIWKR